MPAFVSYRGIVYPSQCDPLGHMNVAHYFAACSDGVGTLQCELGITGRDMANGRKLSFAVVRAESDFFAELHAGDSIHLETEVLEIGGKSITFRHTLYRAPDRERAFRTTFKCVLLDLRTRRAADVPEEVREKAASFMVEARHSGAEPT